MEDRIRFIEHQAMQILLVDVSHCTPAEVAKIVLLVPSYVTSEPRGSVLLLADFTGAEFDRIAIDRLKESAVFDRPHLKRSAWAVSYTHLYIVARYDQPVRVSLTPSGERKNRTTIMEYSCLLYTSRCV